MVAGIETRVVRTGIPDHSAEDAMVIRLGSGEVAPWHTHDETCETAWVVSGTGTLVTREAIKKLPGGVPGTAAESGLSYREDPHPLRSETVILIPAGLQHMVENDGTEPLVIFAIHSATGPGTTDPGTQHVFTQEGKGNE